MTMIPYGLIRKLRGLPSAGPASRSVTIGAVTVVNPDTADPQVFGEAVTLVPVGPTILGAAVYAAASTEGIDRYRLSVRMDGDHLTDSSMADYGSGAQTFSGVAVTLLTAPATVQLAVIFDQPSGQGWSVFIPAPPEDAVDPTWTLTFGGVESDPLAYNAAEADVAAVLPAGWSVAKQDSNAFALTAPVGELDPPTVALSYDDGGNPPSVQPGQDPQPGAPAEVDLTDVVLFLVTEAPA